LRNAQMLEQLFSIYNNVKLHFSARYQEWVSPMLIDEFSD
jgi:hypothetical protein